MRRRRGSAAPEPILKLFSILVLLALPLPEFAGAAGFALRSILLKRDVCPPAQWSFLYNNKVQRWGVVLAA